jgi:hypothetical protein
MAPVERSATTEGASAEAPSAEGPPAEGGSARTRDALVALALARVGGLRGDDAKEGALRVLSRAANAIADPPPAVARAFEQILALGQTFSDRASRTRAFGDACQAIALSLLPLARRRELLDRALDTALGCTDAPERIAAATAALDARIDVRWGERTEETLADLGAAASAIVEEEPRARALLAIATSLSRAGETDDALRVVDGLPPSGRRALGIARVAFALNREGLPAEAATLVERALAEAHLAAPSAERTRAVHDVLEHAVATGLDLRNESALAAGIDAALALESPSAQRDALRGAIRALPESQLDDEALSSAAHRVDDAIDRVDDLDARVDLRGRLAVSLAALGDVDASVAALRSIAALVSGLRAAGIDGPHVSLPIALPVLEILGVLAGDELPADELPRFAQAAIALSAGLTDQRGVAALLGEMTRFFASPALPYPARVALLDQTLAAAGGVEADDLRVELCAHVADALSMSGADERGDALFAGLVAGIGARRAREARLVRAVTLVRLGRTADARAEIAAAAAVTAPTFHEVEELAMTMARCGFLADMLSELARIDPSRQGEARAQLADRLVEATYLDPHLREIGLSALLEGTEGPVRHTIACLLDQVRVLEGLGDVEVILARAFASTAALEDRRTASIFDRQLVDALIERIRAAPAHDDEA